MLLKTKDQVEDFVRGCTFFGTGGGGLAKNGVASLLSELEKGREISWIDVNDVSDDDWTACPFLMGSIAPKTEEIIKEMDMFGLNNPVNTEKDRLAKAISELSEYTGKKISAIVPIELGGANTPGGVAAGLMLGIPIVDGDYTGRAIPEIPQTTPYLLGKKLWPITSVDEWNNVTIIREATNYAMAERIGKLIASGAYGLSGDAGFLMTGKETKEAILPGTLTESYNVGRFIRETRDMGENPIEKVVAKLGGWVLFRGIVSLKEWEDRVGYYWGTHSINGTGMHEGKTLKIWFKNENHICWKNDQIIVTSPDLIIVVDSVSGEPFTNPEIQEGNDVTVIGLKAKTMFRSEKGIKILGPKAFGFDHEYRPIEEQME